MLRALHSYIPTLRGATPARCAETSSIRAAAAPPALRNGRGWGEDVIHQEHLAAFHHLRNLNSQRSPQRLGPPLAGKANLRCGITLPDPNLCVPVAAALSAPIQVAARDQFRLVATSSAKLSVTNRNGNQSHGPGGQPRFELYRRPGQHAPQSRCSRTRAIIFQAMNPPAQPARGAAISRSSSEDRFGAARSAAWLVGTDYCIGRKNPLARDAPEAAFSRTNGIEAFLRGRQARNLSERFAADGAIGWK
jgi:hypothetical protein